VVNKSVREFVIGTTNDKSLEIVNKLKKACNYLNLKKLNILAYAKVM